MKSPKAKPLAPITSYAKYDAHGITELLCTRCVTPRELELIEAKPNGVVAIRAQGAVVCSRCGIEA
jgi:hypothetical protein